MNILTLRKSLNKIKIFNNVKDVDSFCKSIVFNRSIPEEDLVVFKIDHKSLNYNSKNNFKIEGEEIIFMQKFKQDVLVENRVKTWDELLERLNYIEGEDYITVFPKNEDGSLNKDILLAIYSEEVANTIEHNINDPENLITEFSAVILTDSEEQEENREICTVHIGKPIWGEL